MYSEETYRFEKDNINKWIQSYKKSKPHFKYSFGFLEGLYTKIEEYKSSAKSFDVMNLLILWSNTVKTLITMKNDIERILYDNLKITINYENNTDLVNIKKDIIKWICNDRRIVNERQHVIINSADGTRKVKLFDENGQIFPYKIQGKEYDEALYRLKQNEYYLTKMYEYFEMFSGLMSNIKNENSVEREHDYRLKISMDWWDP